MLCTGRSRSTLVNMKIWSFAVMIVRARRCEVWHNVVMVAGTFQKYDDQEDRGYDAHCKIFPELEDWHVVDVLATGVSVSE